MSQPIDRRGGARRGAGRPRKGQGLRVTMSLSVDPVTLEQARRLRKAGFPLADHIAALVEGLYNDNFKEEAK